MNNRKKIAAGNWKMHKTLLEGQGLAHEIRTMAETELMNGAEIIIFPPFIHLVTLKKQLEGSSIQIGAQNMNQHEQGAYTGEISAAMLSSIGMNYVLIGHSERRQLHGEDNETVRAKTAAAFRHGLVPVICVGETLEELESEGQSAVPVRQTLAALAGHDKLGEFVIAYEPVWAIGTGKVATAEEAAAVCGKIREALAAEFGEELAQATRILYGGSVKANNVAGFLRSTEVDGVLVGGASLDAEEFSGIARFLKHIAL